MDVVYTTLAQIRACSPCIEGWTKLCKRLGGIKAYGENTPITFQQIFESNGYDDTLWCLRTVDPKFYPLWRHFACDAAQDVIHLIDDDRSKMAIDVARLHADGFATDNQLAAARDAARDAAWDAARAAAWDAARAAAWDAQIARLYDYCKYGQRPVYNKIEVVKKEGQ